MHNSKLLLLLPLLLFAACSKGQFYTPTEALEAYLDRSIAGDKSGARECLVADERDSDMTFTIDPGTKSYTVEGIEMEGAQAIVAVRFNDQSEDMNFVLVDKDGWHVSLGFTIAHGLSQEVGREIEALGPNPTPEQMAAAMQRGMRLQPAGR